MPPHMSQTETLIKGEGGVKNMTCATGMLWKESCIYWQGDEDKGKRNATICISFLKWSWKELTNSGQNSQGNGIRLFSLKEESIKCLGNCTELNVKILSTELPGCSALTGVIHIFILSLWLLFPLQSEERTQNSQKQILLVDFNVHFMWHMELLFSFLSVVKYT